MKFKQVTIIGVGLIGGSIGLAVKKRRLSSRVIGVTAHKKTLKKALKRRAIDTGTLNVKKSVIGSDMVILATPVDNVLSMLKKITPYLKKGCVVIDVASVKGAIVKGAEKIIGRKAYFIGAHPMAGSEQRGIDRADSNLFKNAPCVLTKTRRTNRKALRNVVNLWKAMGSKIYILSPAEHDRKICNISHLPHIAAAALALSAKPSALEFASTGFGDTTRIASSSPDLWIPILLANRENVVKDLGNYLKELKNIRNSIISRQKGKLKGALRRAKKRRDQFKIK
jgi:prephenate dehydrogenase